MTREEFFNKKAAGALWDVGVSIKRGNPLPLDADSVFASFADAQTYVNGVLSYPGQLLAVVPETGDTVIYYVKPKADGSGFELAEVGGKLILDETTITKTADGKLCIKGFAEAENGAQLVKQDGALAWVKPDTTTVEGLSTKVATLEETTAGHTTDITSLKTLQIKKLASATAGMSASYQLEKDGVKVGDIIDIPKDLVVESGTVETYAEAGAWGEAGTYIVLTIANKTSDKLYIPVDGLIEYVTGGAAADGIITTSVDEHHVLTATITDGTITKAKLVQAVQDSLGKADSAVQEVVAGETIGTIKVDSTPVTVITDAHIKTTVADDIATAKTEAITAAGTNADTKISAKVGDLGEKTVKAYVDDADATLQGKIDTINTTIGGLDLKALAHKDKVSEADLDTELGTKVADIANKANSSDVTANIATAKSEAIADAEGKIATAKSELIGVKTGEGASTKDSDTIEGAKRYADAVASGAQGGLVGNETDTSDKNTIYGAKKYADEKATAAKTAAEKTAADALAPVSEKATANEAAITKLNGDKTVTGSVSNKIDSALTDLAYEKTATEGEFLVSAKQENGKISVVSKALTASDIPTLTTAKLSDFDTKMAEKQDKLTFTDTPSAENKVTTKKYVDDTVTAAVADLSGAMHFIGESTVDPTGEAGPTVEGYAKAFKAGDVVTFGNKEYVLDKTGAWKELGDEASYIVKGTKFKDADIAADAAIAQSKIATTGSITDAIAAAKAAAEAAQADATANAGAIATINNLDIIKNTEATIKAVKVDAAVKADQDGDGNVIKTTYATKAEVTALDDSLAAIAKTGNVNDLVQTAGDVIVLDCN